MRSLRDIFDNEITLPSDKWDSYFEVYERHLNRFVDTNPTIVEIGVQGGGSIEMWRKYFGEGAKIYGIDIDPRITQHADKYDSNVQFVIGNQGSINFWKSFFDTVGPADIIIDDGGHTMDQQKTSFIHGFPNVRCGGVYICEDIQTNYGFPHYNYGGGLYKQGTFIEYIKRAIDIVSYQFIPEADRIRIDPLLYNTCKLLKSVSFYNSIVVFEKGDGKDSSSVIANPDKIVEFLNS